MGRNTILYGTKEYFELAGKSGILGNSWGTRWKAYTKLRYRKYIKMTRDYWKCGEKTILDIGCNDGDFLKKLHNLKQNNKLYGIDCSTVAISNIRKDYVQAYNCSVDEMPESFKNKFDLIYCSGTIYYCNSFEIAFKNIFESMKKDGIFLLEFQNNYNNYKKTCMIRNLKKYFNILDVDYEYGKWYQDFFEEEWRESYALSHTNRWLWIKTLILLSNSFIAYLFEYMTCLIGKGTMGISGTILLCEVKK